ERREVFHTYSCYSRASTCSMVPTITSTLCPKAAMRTASNSRWSGYAGTISIESMYGGESYAAREPIPTMPHEPSWALLKWLCSPPQHGRRAARHVLSWSGWRHFDGPANASIQNISGLPQGLEGRPAAGWDAENRAHGPVSGADTAYGSKSPMLAHSPPHFTLLLSPPRL